MLARGLQLCRNVRSVVGMDLIFFYKFPYRPYLTAVSNGYMYRAVTEPAKPLFSAPSLMNSWSWALQLCINIRRIVGLTELKKNIKTNFPTDHTWRPWVTDIELPCAWATESAKPSNLGCFRPPAPWILNPEAKYRLNGCPLRITRFTHSILHHLISFYQEAIFVFLILKKVFLSNYSCTKLKKKTFELGLFNNWLWSY